MKCGVTYVDNFANSGGRRLKIESFDKCEDVGRIQTCDVDEGTGGKILYVGKNCENDDNGDSDTKMIQKQKMNMKRTMKVNIQVLH